MATDLRLPTNRIVMPDKDHPLDENNPFEGMMSRFDRAAQLLDLEPGLYKVLRHPEKQVIVSVPVFLTLCRAPAGTTIPEAFSIMVS